MTRPAEIEQKAGEAFRALQARAKAEHGGNTQPLLVVYAVESFLRRLSISAHADQMVLKGGMLMAASRIRQMTKTPIFPRTASPTTRSGYAGSWPTSAHSSRIPTTAW